jgi:hypothetical protein
VQRGCEGSLAPQQAALRLVSSEPQTRAGLRVRGLPQRGKRGGARIPETEG